MTETPAHPFPQVPLPQWYWLFFDSDAEERKQAITAAAIYEGMETVHQQVLAGQLSKNRLDNLLLALEDCMEPDKDRLYLLPVSQEHMKAAILMGQAIDPLRAGSQIKNLFL